MEESSRWSSHRRRRKDNIGAVSFGVFLILIGAMFVITPNLYSAVLTFFRDDLRPVQIDSNIFLLAPESNHPVLYLAVEVFCYLWGLFQIVVLVLRFSTGSPIYLTAKTLSRVLFWLGAGWLTRMLRTQILGVGSQGWFAFWSAMVVLLGLSLIVQALVLAAAIYGKPR